MIEVGLRKVYLDYAAATPVDDRVMAAMLPFYSDVFANPSAVYRAGIEARASLDEARLTIARLLGVNVQRIVFTAGATESINLAINGIMERYPEANVVSSDVEHEAVLACVEQYSHSLAGCDKNGYVDVESVRSQINDRTVLVSIMYANNEVGTTQPIKDIAMMIHRIRKQRLQNGNHLPLLLHSDASQAASYLSLAIPRLGVDLLTLNGGKAYGPKQSGVLYIADGVDLSPVIRGGGQERSLRSGTENVANAAGLAEAFSISQNTRNEESARIAKLRDKMQARLSAEVEGLRINGHSKKRLPNSLSITKQGLDGERAVMELDEMGVMIATGSACSASSDSPSHVLLAMGMTPEQASATLRITLGRQTTDDQIDYATKAIIDILNQ